MPASAGEPIRPTVSAAAFPCGSGWIKHRSVEICVPAPAFTLLLLYGLRRGEVLGLRQA